MLYDNVEQPAARYYGGLPTDSKLEWPPPETRKQLPKFERWGAWYSGDVSRLAAVYDHMMSTVDAPPIGYHLRSLPIAAQTRERMFWGNTGRKAGLAPARLHIPLAADIAATSADLLFGEPPTLYMADDSEPDSDETPKRRKGPVARLAAKVYPSMFTPTPGVDDGGAGGEPQATPQRRSHKQTQDFIDAVVEDGMQAALLEAAELCAAYGGIYLRVRWDKDVADKPFLDSVTPDFAVPEWRSRRLFAVTFWKRLSGSDRSGTVWRHLERHEMGRIIHALYKGTEDEIGVRQDLRAHEETEQFIALGLAPDGSLKTGSERLTAEYVPNIAPDRDCPGSPFGRSDLAGIDGSMDALDEAWTSWMRDLRLGKGRLVVPDSMVTDLGQGKGSVFDLEQEIYQTVTALDDGTGRNMLIVQFAIRVAEHQETCSALTAVCVRGAGYTMQAFGEEGDGVAATATEINSRDSRSNKTRARKIGYWSPAVRRIVSALIDVAIEHFGPDGVKPIPPSVEFSDGVARDPEANANAVKMLKDASAISTYTAVKLTNPDWAEDQIREEVDRIREDSKATMSPLDPMKFGDASKPGGGPPGPAQPPTANKEPPK